MKSPIIKDKKEDKSQKWVLPGTSMSEEEFVSGFDEDVLYGKIIDMRKKLRIVVQRLAQVLKFCSQCFFLLFN